MIDTAIFRQYPVIIPYYDLVINLTRKNKIIMLPPL